MKSAIITQARMTSTRLPGKILLEVAGLSLLEHHIQRLQKSGLPVIVAMTNEPEDNVLEKFCRDKGLTFFRGDQDNVLSRFYLAAKENNLDTIIRATSDCPLIDGQLIREGLAQFEKNNCEYLSNCRRIRKYPRGMDFEIFKFAVLEKAFIHSTDSFEQEHVTPYIWKSKPNEFQIEDIVNPTNDSDLRITVDTQDDYLLIQKLIEDHQAHQLSCDELIKLLRSKPELVAINSHIEQKKE